MNLEVALIRGKRERFERDPQKRPGLLIFWIILNIGFKQTYIDTYMILVLYTQGPRAKFDTLHIRTYRVPYIFYRLKLSTIRNA